MRKTRLGPNGAGKTTLVKILSTVLVPTAGTARVLGHDVTTDTARVRPLIGIVFGGERGLYWRLTARQNLRYWAALYRQDDTVAARRADALLERVGLAGHADARVETFSRGMKQRLHLARGLVGDPKVVFLDEPTTGMDPVAAREFRALVGELRGEGRTVLLTTHDMVEAEAVCDRVTLIDHGRLVGSESPRTIGRWVSTFERVDVDGADAALDDALLERVRALEGVGSVETIGAGAHGTAGTGAGAGAGTAGTVRITTVAQGATTRVLACLVDAGVTSVRTSLPSLEEVYLHLVGDRGLKV